MDENPLFLFFLPLQTAEFYFQPIAFRKRNIKRKQTKIRNPVFEFIRVDEGFRLVGKAKGEFNDTCNDSEGCLRLQNVNFKFTFPLIQCESPCSIYITF